MIPIARPMLDEAEIDAVRETVLSGWITQGPAVASFEEEFAAYVGSNHACAVADVHAALHLALRALGVGPGDEGHHRQPFLHRHGQCDSILRRDYRCSSISIRARTTWIRTESEAAIRRTRGDSRRASDGDAVRSARAILEVAISGVEPAGDRRCRLRDRQRDPNGRVAGRESAAARRHRLLLLSSAQVMTTGDGWEY